MEEYTQITLNEWMEWKEDIRRKLAETASNFVYIGYRLRQISESGILDGCADIFEFAQKEYGLGKSTTSRFIAINERFSEDGYSLQLKEEYRLMSSSKLAEMLTLTDAECQLITEKTTVKEIRELKQFSRQQESEEESQEQVVTYSPLQKCIIDYFSDKSRKEILNDVLRMLAEDPSQENQQTAAELINPGEYTTHKKGIVFLFMYDWTNGIKYKLMGQPDPVSMSWTMFFSELVGIYGQYGFGSEDIWENFYGKGADKEQSETTEKVEENQGPEPSVATSQREENETAKEVPKERECAPVKEEETPTAEEWEPVPEDLKPEYQHGGGKGDGTSWKEKPEKKEKEFKLPPADAQYTLAMGKTMIKDIRDGQRYLILKLQNPYRVGNTLHLQEHADGEKTGTEVDIQVTHVTEDHGGITPGYCVLQFELLPEKEKQLERQLSIEDLENENENKEEADKEAGIHGESQESDT